MAMKKCKECGNEISSSAKTCPNCGKKQGNPIIAAIVIILAIIIIVGIVGSEPSTTVDPVTGQTITKEKFTLESHSGAYDEAGFAFYIEGTIKNNTDKTYSYAQVTFNVYDETGAQVGTAIDNINNLEPNGTWKYKAMAMTSDKIASYKFVEITGF